MYEVKVTSELELKARLQEAAAADLARREAVVSAKEAELGSRERELREQSALALRQQQQDALVLQEAGALAGAQAQDLDQVGCRSWAMPVWLQSVGLTSA